MLFRSTNSKFTHFQGDLVSNVDDSSHGVHLTGGSTGGIVTAAGDEANIALTVRAKGSGPLTLGSSGSAVTIAGGASFAGFIKFTDTAVATPNFATTNAMVMETTHVITGLAANTIGGTTGWFVIANGHNLSTDCALVGAYVGSTATELHCRFLKASTLTVANTTATIQFLIIRA